jgi:autophagy-related protein 2
MPKRLLRYALSRLELLDADALDLDNLDLAWGRNTVLEFRDVGIRLKVSRAARSLAHVINPGL